MDPDTDRPKDRFRLDGRFALVTGANSFGIRVNTVAPTFVQ
jgi:hypothetical protein